MDIDMAEIAQLFIEESEEGLATMESGLLELTMGAADPETINTIFRAAHSIKGGGATFGFTEVSEFAHHVETLLDEMRQGQRQVTQAGVDLLLQSVDCIRDMIASLAEGDIDVTRAKELQVDLETMLANPAEPAATDNADPSTSNAPNAEPGATIGWSIHFKPHAEMLRSGSDPLRLFRELEELGPLDVVVKGVDELDFATLDPQVCTLAWAISLHEPAPREQIEEIFVWVVDECDLLVDPILAPSTPMATPTKPKKASSNGPDSGSIRVNIDKIDALINLVGELVITQSMLSRFNGDFDFTQLPKLRDGLSQLHRNSRDLQESVMAVRMLPISVAFSRFPRLVRDTSNALGKQVELQLTGENTELDKTVLEKIGDPLVHLVRNSLDHGLEIPEIRLAAGKPEVGIIALNAYHEGGNIVIEVVDDGAGINGEKVLAKAREKGLVASDEQLSEDQINNLVFMAGFSTADKVSDLSGRGVGMDVVRRNIADLGGHVSVRSQPGIGSTFTIRLPLTMAILDGQLVRVGKESYIISLVSIAETIQSSADKINQVAGQAELFQLRDVYLPILRLHELFGIEADSTNIDDGLLVVVEANGQRVGIFVDDLQEQQQVVIKSLEANYRQTQGISGATILGDGKVALILDVPGLIQLFYNQNAAGQNPTPAVAGF
ncbi:MAG: chemotaxis protein CheA [Gammaproteobacteria bacterium]|nr:chemotaxis protein CheA [Gammaproteobacteria bacterium]